MGLLSFCNHISWFIKYIYYCCLFVFFPAFGAAAAAKPLQSCPTLCNPIDSSPPGSPIPQIFQARTLEWVAISFFNAGKWKVRVKSLSHVQLLATPWTAAYQVPLSMGFFQARVLEWVAIAFSTPSGDHDLKWILKRKIVLKKKIRKSFMNWF